MFGALGAGSAGQFVATIPEIAWEASLGIYAAWKGFRPSPITSEAWTSDRGLVRSQVP
jgi:hypothetical protein